MLAAAVLLALALGAVALAATGVIGNGKAFGPPPGAPLNPHAFLGVPKPGSAQLLKVEVQDPAGGPPWGLRYVATTRGLGCVQVGRLVRDDIGVLGQDGAFKNDGRFHRLPETYLGSEAGPFPCGTLDARGHVFGGIYAHGVPASGLIMATSAQPGCSAARQVPRLAPARLRHELAARQRHVRPRCPAGDWRAVTVGMAGPEATSVTYDDEGQMRTIPTVGEQGAYLIVQRVNAKDGVGFFEPLGAPGGGPIVRIDYRNGHSCRIHTKLSIQRLCPPVGRVLPATPKLTRADVASPVRARIQGGQHGRRVVISFVARVPVRDATSAYEITLRFSGPEVNCRGMIIGPLLRDVRRGQRIRFREPTNGCHGIFKGRVAYRYGMTNAFPPLVQRGPHALTVGRFTVDGR